MCLFLTAINGMISSGAMFSLPTSHMQGLYNYTIAPGGLLQPRTVIPTYLQSPPPMIYSSAFISTPTSLDAVLLAPQIPQMPPGAIVDALPSSVTKPPREIPTATPPPPPPPPLPQPTTVPQPVINTSITTNSNKLSTAIPNTPTNTTTTTTITTTIPTPTTSTIVPSNNIVLDSGFPPAKRKQCHCKNSKCLKLYCECFASRTYCTGMLELGDLFSDENRVQLHWL